MARDYTLHLQTDRETRTGLGKFVNPSAHRRSSGAIQQYLAAGLLDELTLNVPPVLLGGGTRLFDERADAVELEPTGVVEAPDVTHIRYRVRRR